MGTDSTLNFFFSAPSTLLRAKRLEQGTRAFGPGFVWCWGSRPNTHHHSSAHIRSFGRGEPTKAYQSEVSPL